MQLDTEPNRINNTMMASCKKGRDSKSNGAIRRCLPARFVARCSSVECEYRSAPVAKDRRCNAHDWCANAPTCDQISETRSRGTGHTKTTTGRSSRSCPPFGLNGHTAYCRQRVYGRGMPADRQGQCGCGRLIAKAIVVIAGNVEAAEICAELAAQASAALPMSSAS